MPIPRLRAVPDGIRAAITVYDGVQHDGPVPVADLLDPQEYDAGRSPTSSPASEVDGRSRRRRSPPGGEAGRVDPFSRP